MCDSNKNTPAAGAPSGGRPKIRVIETQSIPVYNCQVLLRHGGGYHARVANLAGIDVSAANEREALQQIVALFKARVTAFQAAGQPIPWLEPPLQGEADESERLIAVHL